LPDARPGDNVDDALALKPLSLRRVSLERLKALTLSTDERVRVEDELRRIEPFNAAARVAAKGILDGIVHLDPASTRRTIDDLRAAARRLPADLGRDLDELGDALETVQAPLEAVVQASGERPATGPALPDHQKIVERLSASGDASENLRRGCSLLAAIRGFRLPGSLEPADRHWLDAAGSALTQNLPPR
jgi:hypothetical protein